MYLHLSDEDVASNHEDLNVKQVDMEYILNQYQQMVDNRNQIGTKSKSCRGSNIPKRKAKSNSKVNIGQFLKPKIPPSLKQVLILFGFKIIILIMYF